MNKIHAFLIFIGFINFACQSDSQKSKSNQSFISLDSSHVAREYVDLNFIPYSKASNMPEAMVEIYSPFDNQVFDKGKILFHFNVKNFFNLIQENQKSNLFMSLNGEDPIELGISVFEKELPEGTYRLVVFLADENGFSLKDFGNFVSSDFHVGEVRTIPYSAEPYLLVNHPIDGIVMDSKDKLKLDFLVVDGDMKLDHLELSVSINGTYVYTINEMKPFIISNLPSGSHQIIFQLKRIDGKELEGQFSKVIKSIIVR